MKCRGCDVNVAGTVLVFSVEAQAVVMLTGAKLRTKTRHPLLLSLLIGG
jgi:hypothetical protein